MATLEKRSGSSVSTVGLKVGLEHFQKVVLLVALSTIVMNSVVSLQHIVLMGNFFYFFVNQQSKTK